MAAPKKGFDKEYIFNLIMPSAPVPDAEETPAATPAGGVGTVGAPGVTGVAVGPGTAGTAGATGTAATPAAPDSLSQLREKMNRPVGAPVQLRPAKDLVLVNLAEQLVADRLDAVFDKFNCCRCDKCRRDVAALALNNVTPQYVVALPEEVPDLLEAAETKEIAGALVKAILYVKANPKH